MRKRTKQHTRSKVSVALLVLSLVIMCFPTVSEAAFTDTPEQQFRQLYLNLLESGDSSQQDITDLNLPYMTCYKIMQEVKQNEGFAAYQSYIGYNLLEPDEIGNDDGQQRLLKFHMSQSDEGFLERYAQIKEIIEEVQKNLDDKMTDFDKLLWIHEYVVEHIYYNNTNEEAGHLGGTTLVQGYGVCEGYAQAMMLFLKAENIPCKAVDGGTHEWVAVEIGGEWYHVDPTWDDTCSGSVGTHYFLLRNDDEFINTLARKHDQWTSGSAIEQSTNTISDSTEYADWYVHKVWNKMYYYDGYWYYILDNAVRKNNILGTDESVLYEGENLTITGLKDDVLEVSSAAGKRQLDLSENTVTAVPTKVVLPTTTVTPITTLPPTAKPTVTVKPTVALAPNTTKKIKVGKPVIKSVTNKKGKKAKIVLKKKVSGASGYEIKYSTDKKFKKNVKTVRFTGTSKTISKLRKNKTYYVKVRAYKKNSNGYKSYGAYSSVKKVKIKK